MMRTALMVLIIGAGIIGATIIAARLLFPAPKIRQRDPSTAFPPAESGPLWEALSAVTNRHKGHSGLASLREGMDAFVARMRLANAAVSSIDVQYYIWRRDMTGHLLLKALLRAADRGVRVRLLLDDNGISGLDDVLAAMNDHANIEVRLFNPFVLRRIKWASYGFDFPRLNHRMHNKSFTVDGRVSILGGRNVGDEYFGTGLNPLQVDLDVLAVGSVVPEVSADFDRYWNADAVFEAARILRQANLRGQLAARLSIFEKGEQFSTYCAQLGASDVVSDLAQGTLQFEWARATLISDDPLKIFGPVPKRDLFTSRLLRAVGPIERRFDGVTPYFVPGDAGVKAVAKLSRAGVRVRVLTNSLEATNMLPVHAGYSKHRKALLRHGIKLFEMRAQAARTPYPDRLGPIGSSGANLHAKTFAVDGRRIFIGSFNFDPRSATLNTEMGLVIESRRMAEELHSAFDSGMGSLAWQVQLRGEKPVWVNVPDETEQSIEPGSTFLKRAALRVIGWLPVEWLL